MEDIENVLALIRDKVWSMPLLILLLGTGAYLTYLLKGVQFRYLGYAFKQIYAEQKKSAEGDINPYEALMTTLAGAIGTGSIVGISTALVLGGLGALFWMWVTALLGMATKYAESLLAIKYRNLDSRGEMIGGPMEYIEKGLKKKWLAIVFAIFGSIAALGTGNLVQVNSIAAGVNEVWSVDPWVTGMLLSLITGFVVIGGIKALGHVAGVLVPVMATLYIGAGLFIIGMHLSEIPSVLGQIVSEAFGYSAIGGGIAGSAFLIALQVGVSRSVFSNEAGLGISSIAAAAARTDLPGRQAMINMTGALISTVIVCTITGLVIAVTGALNVVDAAGNHLNGAKMAIYAFQSSIPGGEYIVTIGLILFAFTTVIAWGYYGEKCFEYLFGERFVMAYRVIYCLLVIPGAALKLEIAWLMADITNGLMAIPNLIALVGLSGIIVKETREFLTIVSKENIANEI